jgi:hypothetical protein
MKPIAEKTLDTILNQQDPHSILGFIQKKIQQLNQLNEIWRKNYPDLAQHSRIANFREDCLVIEIDNAAWATRLRYLIPDLIIQLAQHSTLNNLKHIEWYIQPSYQIISQSRPLAPILSDTSAQLLQNTASTIRMKPLQEALIRLAENN